MIGHPFSINPTRFRPALSLQHLNWKHGAFIVIFLCLSLSGAQSQNAGTSDNSSAFQTLLIWMPFILKGFLLNLLMSFLAIGIATILGILLGLLQISKSGILRWPAHLFTHVFRNSPWLVILFMIMYLLPFEMRLPWGGVLVLPDWLKATVAFSLPVMANIAEILRGAVASIPRGQWESAESLAFTYRQTLWMIILPQCVKRMIPAWMNWYALLALATPMASLLGVSEAVGNAQAAMTAAGSRPELLIPFYLFLMLLFFIYIYPIAIWTRRLERKYAVNL